MTTISIKTDDDGQIINRFIGSKSGEDWIQTSDADWPDASPTEDETPQYFYDASTGEISVQYKTVTPPEDDPTTQ